LDVSKFARRCQSGPNGDKCPSAADCGRSWERTLKNCPLAPHTDLLSKHEGSGSNHVTPRQKGWRSSRELWCPKRSTTMCACSFTEADARFFPHLWRHPFVSSSEGVGIRCDSPLGAARTHYLTAPFSGQALTQVVVCWSVRTPIWDGASLPPTRGICRSSNAETPLAA